MPRPDRGPEHPDSRDGLAGTEKKARDDQAHDTRQATLQRALAAMSYPEIPSGFRHQSGQSARMKAGHTGPNADSNPAHPPRGLRPRPAPVSCCKAAPGTGVRPTRKPDGLRRGSAGRPERAVTHEPGNNPSSYSRRARAHSPAKCPTELVRTPEARARPKGTACERASRGGACAIGGALSLYVYADSTNRS